MRALDTLPRLTPGEVRAGLQWYYDAGAFCEQFAPLPVSAGVLAVLSPLTPWQRNKELTAETFAGRYPRSMNGTKADAIANYDANPWEVVSGPKVRAFWQAILCPEAIDAEPVIDSHMLKVMQWPKGYYPKPYQYRKLSEEFRAWKEREYPSDPIHAVQAALWVRQRGTGE